MSHNAPIITETRKTLSLDDGFGKTTGGQVNKTKVVSRAASADERTVKSSDENIINTGDVDLRLLTAVSKMHTSGGPNAHASARLSASITRPTTSEFNAKSTGSSLSLTFPTMTTVSASSNCQPGDNYTGESIDNIADMCKVKMRSSFVTGPTRDRKSKMLDVHPVLIKGQDSIDGGSSGSGGNSNTKAVFKMKYFGNVQLDRRITQPMLPWILANKQRSGLKTSQNIFLQISSRGALGISESKGSILFEHFPQNITRFTRGHNKKCFAYLWRTDSDSNFSSFVFETSDQEVVHQIAVAVRDASKEAMKYNVLTEEEKARAEAIDNLRINNATMFEVLYCGRVTVSHKRASPTLIDDTIAKFNVHELENQKKKLSMNRKRHFSTGDQNGASPSPSLNDGGGGLTNHGADAVSSDEVESPGSLDLMGSSSPPLDPEDDSGSSEDAALSPVSRSRVASAGAAYLKRGATRGLRDASTVPSVAPVGSVAEENILTSGHNRTMLFQIGKSILTLISPDKKSFMLTKKFNDISFCSQGIKQPEFFGFICREKTAVASYMCYVFKCQSEPVVDGIMTTLRQSFNVALQKSKLHVICATCPMHQLHKLCQTLEGQVPEKAHIVLLKQLETLNETERNSVVTKAKDAKATSAQEANEIIMCELMAICEQQQNAHTHSSDGDEGRSSGQPSPVQGQRSADNKVSPSETSEVKVGAFSKAKKSLASSFENLLSRKKKSSTEDPGFPNTGYRSRQGTMDSLNSESSKESPRDSPIPMTKTTTTNPNTSPPSNQQPAARSTPTDDRSSPPTTIATTPNVDLPAPTSSRPDYSPAQTRPDPMLMCKQDSLPECMMLPTMRPRSKTLGDTPSPSPKTPPPDSSFQYPSIATSPLAQTYPMKKVQLERTSSAVYDEHSPSHYSPHSGTSHRRMSWRQQIFNRVVTPISEAKHGQAEIAEESTEDVFEIGGLSPCQERRESTQRPPRFASPQQIRSLWKKAIREQILLIRMDKENKNLQARQDAAHEKRIKLDYEEITPCLKEVTVTWERILSRPNRSSVRVSRKEINATFREGIPKGRRGEIWQFIYEQQILTNLTNAPIPEHEPYKELLKQLTIHQHAILIDLGRTFPTHPYFANSLGRGQLSLFNLLKAYSLLDTDVGYCQGLSFVAGVLLMHMDEEQSFDMLMYLMFSLGFRRQYKPDMTALQIQMYQLSRLLHDFHKRLYNHLEHNEIGPSLYAAPWFLTLFASQFPLGFVAKVFDLIFLQGFEVIFKVALIVLGSHEELLLHCDGFEAIIEFLKDTLPTLGIIQMENIINKAYQLDISKQLQAYEVEYHVLQEEMAPSPVHQRAAVKTDVKKLEVANRKLRRHNNELLEQLQGAHNTIHSQEAVIHNLRKNEDKHKSEIRSLNLERSALLNTVAKLRTLLPRDVPIEEAGINFTTSSSSSPPFILSEFDDKDSSPLDQRADSGTGNLSGSQTCSLDDLDTEVATLTTTNKEAWRRNRSNGSSGSEISTSTSSEMDGPISYH